ncbi:16S rRNA (guanine(527)-N(7))-methyltransferase RsmG [Micromonospora sp. NBC_01796]|uniref:16S rRNA (guanine(527)-N(7))-methyltransferase RsmG n=1 Tax=Micromonospora sp. NBC_01796 TaxID=2975987 RepID=UPI002DDBA3F3|nr:16S rRNA (guanine(527)-N(7))-methyltransferase RsmG [Micromonospora sp. NBC_01796]WSA89810.1 16S rRNA (guanine(527)-N(7))-methyltransferase RsmG [Micromonospora sp. NBC_01796]
MTYDPAAHAAAGPGGDTPPGPSSSTAPDGLDPAALPAASNPSTAPAAGEPGPPDVSLPDDLADAARTLFGDRLDLATAYAELLATDGVLRGLIGPREAPRIWDRHLLNCAAVAELIPTGSSVLDVGSGAGLPGIVLAIARPDLSVVLVEPLARRTAFLTEAVTALGLDSSVTVLRARAEELAGGGPAGVPADIVTARAVAPLDRLAGWCLPLTTLGGRVLALKGSSAADEVAEYGKAVARLGGAAPQVRHCGVGLVDPPTTVVEIVRERLVGPALRDALAKRRAAARAESGRRGGGGRARGR